jgi:hypothetical protein
MTNIVEVTARLHYPAANNPPCVSPCHSVRNLWLPILTARETTNIAMLSCLLTGGCDQSGFDLAAAD